MGCCAGKKIALLELALLLPLSHLYIVNWDWNSTVTASEVVHFIFLVQNDGIFSDSRLPSPPVILEDNFVKLKSEIIWPLGLFLFVNASYL